MAISTVNVDFSAILQNAAQATGLLRVRLSQVGTVEDSETGDTVILPIAWQETTLTDGAATLALVPNKIIEPSCTYYEIQLKSVPDCPKACAKLLLSGIMYVPDEDCNVLDLLISPPSPETANTASGYASQAKQAAQVAENFAIQAGDRYDDVAEAAATALTDIGTAKQDALDAIGTAQSGATEAISTAEDAALQAIGQARGSALDDIGTAQGTAIGAVQAEGNTQVGRVYDAGEDAVADVTAAQATAVSAVQAQQGTSVAAVSAEGTAQVNAVTQAGNGYVSTMQGLVTDAQAARDAAQTARGLAEDAQTAAESASTDAQGYAGDASTSAGQAAQSASDAADSATAAQASAESIAASAEQIQTNEQNITNIQALLNGTLYREETDSTAAYSKSVPTGALPYASVDMIGGKTVVWNQLQNKTTNSTNTAFGVTIAYNGTTQKVSVTGTATSSGEIRLFVGTLAEVFPSGHKILCRTTFTQGWSFRFQGGGIYAANGNMIITANGSQVADLVISIENGVTYNATDETIVFHDLTLMFGSGNEPATVAEFEAMFPSIDPAYNAGELRSAGVTEAVSEGRNLFDMSEGRGYPSDTTISNSTPREFPLRKWVLGISFNNYFYLGNVNSATVDEDANIITVASKVTGYGVGVPFKCEPNTAYTITYTSTVSTVRLAFYSKDNNYISYYSIQPGGTVSSPSTAYNALLVFYSEANTTAVFSNIQLERGSAATEYTPYFSRSLPIPSAVQALPGYGWSAGTAYNYVDFERKVYVQRVGGVDLGSLNWAVRNNNTARQAFQIKIIDEIPSMKIVRNEDMPNFLCASFVTVRGADTWTPDEVSQYFDGNNWLVCTAKTSQYNGAASFKAAMQGVMLQYELATPIETDISSLLTDSTIEVEAGGSLTFKNQHGDDWRVPVPNEETFLVQATPELPTTDGTYTLQCTVTDGTPSVTWVSA